MAITLKTNEVQGAGFVANGHSADWSGCETIVAAVASKSIYIERIYISAQDVALFTFGAGETTGSVTTVVLGPVTGNVGEMVFTRPLKITAATALVVDCDSAVAATIVVQGFIK